MLEELMHKDDSPSHLLQTKVVVRMTSTQAQGSYERGSSSSRHSKTTSWEYVPTDLIPAATGSTCSSNDQQNRNRISQIFKPPEEEKQSSSLRTDTKEFQTSSEQDASFTCEHMTSSSSSVPAIPCDIIYSLPVDNITNPTSSSTTPPRPRGSRPNSSLLTTTDGIAIASPSSSHQSNQRIHSNVNCKCKASQPDRTNHNQHNANRTISGEEELDDNERPNKSTTRSPHDKSERVLENNNNLSYESKIGSNKATRNCIARKCPNKKGKKKRRRSLLPDDVENVDCQQEVPGKIKGTQNTDGLKDSINRLDEKPKCRIGDAFLRLFGKARNGNKEKAVNNAESKLRNKSHQAELNMSRALPPTPCQIVEDEAVEHLHLHCEELSDASSPGSPLEPRDIAASIEKVKDCGWYWGPLSSEGAEDLLRGEPDGSFVVRDSSDSRYIFSLTFKLNSLVRHVRIEHDQGNFSFGPMTRFKSSTIVDFIEKAIAHSRSGRYLFFLHRRPVLGPMRVQLIHPFSRFKTMRSLQHMCRFAILKQVRRDLINSLPLPNPLLQYLNTPQYYFEMKE